jgi:general secretion pathway protein J
MARRTGLARGFTLVEVLVALLVMAVMAAMGWQGIDGMVRARDISQEASLRTLRLATVLAQWEQDLQSLVDTGGTVPPLGCDGAALRLTRRAGTGTTGGLQMVTWSLRGNELMRWASPVLTRSGELQQAWMHSHQLLEKEDGQLRMIDGASDWQLYFYRGNGWSNCQSSDDLAPAAAPAAPPPTPPASGASGAGGGGAPAVPTAPRAQLPSGVRMVLTLPQGAITRDLVLLPHSP